MNIKVYSFIGLASLTIIASPVEAAKVCRTKIKLPVPEAGTCNIDSTNSKMNNPFAYINPLSGCDLSFGLPGIPDFSLSGLSSALCDTVKQYGQNAINDALAPVLDKLPGNVNLDMEDLMDGMFDKQKEMQEVYCPVYDASGKLISYRCATDPDIETPDWGAGVGDKDPTEGKTCFVKNGITYCYVDKPDTNKPDKPNVPDHKNPDLPLCSELDNFIDENGDLISCRGDYSDPVILPANDSSTNSKTDNGWGTKSNWTDTSKVGW
ncbi:hypothetical protein BOO92_15955 [Vibrio navarrensis]|uniref:hypothetical protein n=1 Tax=Vibrio TaxID=662 RepID=UPI001865E523|nr:hypothetical protein [Vibrio navarrensis]HAS6100856.1 hypothetical protein [Vibrio vulnificus]EHA1126496.1 hypothetical protein [Vibrio navarrensis]MBE3658172.1 hypothetical protein [Vibrio navarrensis]MBH9740062.1 hypothetical protein [Vibrio navarrensis]HDY8121405.1 hypothetical protein [Vibrio vulnificus]